MKDYVIDVVVIWQLEDDVNTLHVNRMNCTKSYKYSYRGLFEQ
jgi:hypothetical protein